MKKGQSMKYRRELLDAAEVERRVRAIEGFAEREGRMPAATRHGEEEARLRSWFDYLMRPSLGLLDEGQRARLERARSRYGRKPVDADEEARFAIRYAREHGEMPHQSDPDPRVRRCAFALLDNPECVGRVSPALREELAKARKDCGVYIYGDAGELVDDYVAFVEREGREPNPKAPALAERRLVHALRRQKDDLDEEQFRRVCQARETVRRRGQTSFSEKVLAEGLRASMDAGCFLGCNVTVGGREADVIAARRDGTRVCVQYDGAVHRGALSAERDRSADATMAARGIAVVRVREPGSEAYGPSAQARVIWLRAPLVELDEDALAAEVEAVASAAGLSVRTAGVDWAEVRREAARASRAETGNAAGAAEYLFRCLVDGCGRPSPEMRKVKGRLDMRFRRGTVGEPAARAIALVEAALDPTVRTSAKFQQMHSRMIAGEGEARGSATWAGRGRVRADAARGPRVGRDVAAAAAEWLYRLLAGCEPGEPGEPPAFEARLREARGRGEIPPSVLRALSMIEKELDGGGDRDPVFVC